MRQALIGIGERLHLNWPGYLLWAVVLTIMASGPYTNWIAHRYADAVPVADGLPVGKSLHVNSLSFDVTPATYHRFRIPYTVHTRPLATPLLPVPQDSLPPWLGRLADRSPACITPLHMDVVLASGRRLCTVSQTIKTVRTDCRYDVVPYETVYWLVPLRVFESRISCDGTIIQRHRKVMAYGGLIWFMFDGFGASLREPPATRDPDAYPYFATTRDEIDSTAWGARN